MPRRRPRVRDRGGHLVDALIVWITPDRQIEPGIVPAAADPPYRLAAASVSPNTRWAYSGGGGLAAARAGPVGIPGRCFPRPGF